MPRLAPGATPSGHAAPLCLDSRMRSTLIARFRTRSEAEEQNKPGGHTSQGSDGSQLRLEVSCDGAITDPRGDG
jgi:hypothetical protein